MLLTPPCIGHAEAARQRHDSHRHLLRAQLQLQPRLHAGRHLLLQVCLELLGLRRRYGRGRHGRPFIHQVRGVTTVRHLYRTHSQVDLRMNILFLVRPIRLTIVMIA